MMIAALSSVILGNKYSLNSGWMYMETEGLLVPKPYFYIYDNHLFLWPVAMLWEQCTCTKWLSVNYTNHSSHQCHGNGMTVRMLCVLLSHTQAQMLTKQNCCGKNTTDIRVVDGVHSLWHIVKYTSCVNRASDTGLLNSKGSSNLILSCVNFFMVQVLLQTTAQSNFCCFYMFQLRIVAIIREPQYYRTLAAYSVCWQMVKIHTIFTIFWHTVHSAYVSVILWLAVDGYNM